LTEEGDTFIAATEQADTWQMSGYLTPTEEDEEVAEDKTTGKVRMLPRMS
jgi:hypothetical protein